jgi:hypothetical protein
VLSGERANSKIIVFGLTRPGNTGYKFVGIEQQSLTQVAVEN